MATTAAIIGAVAAAASAGTGIAGSMGAFGGGGAPKPVNQPTMTDLTKMLVPGQKADAASRVGGGMSPEFLANLVGNEAGAPGAGLDILGDIQKSLGGGGSPTSGSGITA